MFPKLIVKINLYKYINIKVNNSKEVLLLYTIKGQSIIDINEEKYKMNKNDIILVNKGDDYSINSSDDTVLLCIEISYVELCRLLEVESISFLCNSIDLNDNGYKGLEESINKLLRCHINGEKKLEMMSYEIQIIDILNNNFVVSNDRSTNKNIKYSDRIKEIEEYMYSNYGRQITLNDLAEKLFLSVPYLSKFIKKNFGKTFTEYLNTIRLKYAVDKIVNTKEPITRIALESGFSTTFIFNKCFKDNFQMTPSEYRKKFQKDSKYNGEDIKEVESEINLYIDKEKLINRDNNKFHKINVDINNSKIIKKNYNNIINIGYANDLLQSSLQEHIVMLHEEIKFEYARFWGIFNSDMNIKNRTGEYNFYKIDKILDFIISSGMKPFIDLLPKGKKISKNIVEDINFEEKPLEVIDSREWKKLLHKFTIHCINKYGVEEVESWYFEIARSEYIKIIDIESNKEISYFEMFDDTYNLIKGIIPNIKVGGPGANFTKARALEFFEEWKKYDARPDFISIFIYPYTSLVKDGAKVARASGEKNYLNNKVKNIESITSNLDFLCDEIIITEWNCTVSDRNYINDSCFKSAYIVKNILDNIDSVDKIAYRMASDVSAEYLDTDLMLQGGTGFLSKNGIKKPAFYAISFLENISENIVAKGENYLIAKRNNYSFALICHNYKQLNNSYLLNSNENISLDELSNIYEDNKSLALFFNINNIEDRRYRVKSFILNDNHGSILNEWMKIGTDNNLKQDEISYLKGISVPKLDIEYISASNGMFDYTVNLMPNEVRLVMFEIDYV